MSVFIISLVQLGDACELFAVIIEGKALGVILQHQRDLGCMRQNLNTLAACVLPHLVAVDVEYLCIDGMVDQEKQRTSNYNHMVSIEPSAL